MTLKIVPLVGVIASLFLLEYNSSSSSETASCLPPELSVYMRSKAINIDPSQVRVYMDNQISMTAFGQLVSLDEYENLKPYLAKRWEISHEGLEYKFELDPRFRFSNGQPITSKDVAFSIHRLFSKELNSDMGAYLFGYSILGSEAFSKGRAKTIRGISILNDSTIVFKLNEPKSNFLSMLATGPASIVRDNGLYREIKPTEIVSSGPFVVSEFANDKVVLKKNENHPDFDGPSKVTFEFDPRPVCDVLASKKFDLVDAGPYDGSMCADDSYSMSRYSGANIWFISFGKKIEPELRRMIVRCIDKKKYFSALESTNTSAAVLNGLFPSRSNRKTMAANVRSGVKCELPTSRRLVLDVREQHHNTEALAQLFGPISNLSVEVKKIDDLKHHEDRQNGNYDLLFTEFTGTFSDPTYYSSLFYSKGPLINSGYRSEEYDSLAQALTHVSSSHERSSLMSKIEDLVRQDPPAIFVKQHDNLEWIRKSMGPLHGGWFNRYFFVAKNQGRQKVCRR